MKKILSLSLCVLIVALSLCGCGVNTGFDNGKLNIVTTIFPEYDWVKNIIGEQIDNANLNLLLNSGVDLHSFQPSADDIIAISKCDLFIYVGGESDGWVKDTLAAVQNKDMKVINLLEVLKEYAKEEEIKEGMQVPDEEGKECEEGEPEYDEHVWLSLKNAETVCEKIAEALGEIDETHKDYYLSNFAVYKEKLNSLDRQYTEAVNNSTNKTLVFADRFPFRYLTDDYGIDYYAAFVDCSSESNASFETITFLAGKVNELGLKSIITLEGSDKKIAESVKAASNNSDLSILTLNSIQTETDKGDYLKIMESNLEVLKKALSKE